MCHQWNFFILPEFKLSYDITCIQSKYTKTFMANKGFIHQWEILDFTCNWHILMRGCLQNVDVMWFHKMTLGSGSVIGHKTSILARRECQCMFYSDNESKCLLKNVYLTVIQKATQDVVDTLHFWSCSVSNEKGVPQPRNAVQKIRQRRLLRW